MNQQATAAEAFGPFQQALTEGWQKAMASFKESAGDGSGAPMPKFSLAPEKLKEIQAQYVSEVTDLWRQGAAVKPVGDRRFASDAWSGNPLSSFSAAVYLLNARTLLGMADAVETDVKTRSRLRFAIEQWLAATSPSNSLAFNAEAQKKALESQGESIAKGMQNLIHDIRQGHLSMTDESAFEVGRNVATTEGAVVFENELFQLLEYKPLTVKVYERPFLLVPPCINKFYILDLQPENSLVRYAVEQGNTVFLMSWRNADMSMQHVTWDDYVEQGVIEAIRVTQDISGQDKLNMFGFCVGGTIVSTALAVLKARGQDPAASLTLLTTFLDFCDTGALEVFIDEPQVALREQTLAKGGLMSGRDLGSTFSSLRPNDLVWNYVQSNYLKGKEPPAFDLLYWNGDGTSLPGPMFCWYLRNTYLENSLKVPGKLTVAGEKVDLSRIDAPAFIYGSREDHIVPWGAAYASTALLNPKKPKANRFILGASGHIAGVIKPASKKKRSYWSYDQPRNARSKALSAEQWMDGATEHAGSWWPEWAAFLAEHGGADVKAPAKPGSRRYPAIEAAPGRYVKVRAD